MRFARYITVPYRTVPYRTVVHWHCRYSKTGMQKTCRFRECTQPASWDACISMPYTAPIPNWYVADAQTRVKSAKYGPHCTMPPVPPIHAPAINYKFMQLLWGAWVIQTMGASIRQVVATHGYRTPHHLTTWEHVHRCWSTPMGTTNSG